MNWLKRILTPPLIILAALVMAGEEWLWERLKWLTGVLARFPVISWYDAAVMRLPPYPTMFVFLLPAVLLFPAKILGIYWLARGYWLASLVLLISEKVLSTAIVARTYVVCLPKLLTIAWFRRIHDWLTITRDRLYAAIQLMPLYAFVQRHLVDLKRKLRRFGSVIWGKHRRGLWSRWRAIRRWRRIRKATVV